MLSPLRPRVSSTYVEVVVRYINAMLCIVDFWFFLSESSGLICLDVNQTLDGYKQVEPE
jgi:hypothetical protein